MSQETNPIYQVAYRRGGMNDDELRFETRAELTGWHIEVTRAWKEMMPFKRDWHLAGQLAQTLITRLMALDGVIEVSIFPYHFDVKKADLFSWEEIEASVFPVIRDVLGLAPDTGFAIIVGGGLRGRKIFPPGTDPEVAEKAIWDELHSFPEEEELRREARREEKEMRGDEDEFELEDDLLNEE